MRWIKLYTNETLRGSIRFQLTMEEQGIWFNLLCMAGESRSPGIIQASPGVGYPVEFIAAQLRIPKKLLENTLTKLAKQERLTIDGKGIRVINWSDYQSVSIKEKKYRQTEEKL